MPVTEHTRTAIAHANPARSHGHGCTRVCAVRHGGYGAAAPRTDLRGAWPTCALFFFCSLFSPPSFAFVCFSLFFVSSNSLVKKKNPGVFGRVCRPRAWLPRATDGGIRMTLPTTGRRVGHCGEHTAKLESATSGDSPCDHIMRRCLWHVVQQLHTTPHHHTVG